MSFDGDNNKEESETIEVLYRGGMVSTVEAPSKYGTGHGRSDRDRKDAEVVLREKGIESGERLLLALLKFLWMVTHDGVQLEYGEDWTRILTEKSVMDVVNLGAETVTSEIMGMIEKEVGSLDELFKLYSIANGLE